MKKQMLNIFPIVLFILFITACSGHSKELREAAIRDSIAKVQAVADSVKKAEAYFPPTLVIQGTNVNLRVAPKLDAVRIRQLKTGDTCQILEKGRLQTIDDKSDYWYRISFNEKEGWIFGAFSSIKLSGKAENK